MTDDAYGATIAKRRLSRRLASSGSRAGTRLTMSATS